MVTTIKEATMTTIIKLMINRSTVMTDLITFTITNTIMVVTGETEATTMRAEDLVVDTIIHKDITTSIIERMINHTTKMRDLTTFTITDTTMVVTGEMGTTTIKVRD